MSEDREDALMRSLLAGSAAPLGDEAFVQGVMGRVARESAAAQARVSWLMWIGVALAAFLAATNFTAILAEVSRVLLAANWQMPALSGSAGVLLLVALGAGGAYLFSERS